jgi:pimeloyl-ACP methyl ester carboxylesterase
MSFVIWLLAGLAALLLAGLIFQSVGLAIDRHLHQPPGRLVGVPGVRLHIYEEGSGEPAIILESGIAASSLNWRALQKDLATHGRVISYDRAGFGWSNPSRSPRTIANLTNELESLLAATQVVPPILLVAHSFGSLIVREFARRHPNRVAGIVLLDPIDCSHWRALSPEEARRLALGVRFARRGALLAQLGLVRSALLLAIFGARALPKGIARVTSGAGATVVSRIADEVGKMPRALWPAVRAHWSRPESFETMAAYLAQLTQCVNEVPYGSLGDIPLVVVTAEKASASERAEHLRIAALSTRSEHVIAEQSGHWVQLDRPDVVIDAVRRVLVKIKRRAEAGAPHTTE